MFIWVSGTYLLLHSPTVSTNFLLQVSVSKRWHPYLDDWFCKMSKFVLCTQGTLTENIWLLTINTLISHLYNILQSFIHNHRDIVINSPRQSGISTGFTVLLVTDMKIFSYRISTKTAHQISSRVFPYLTFTVHQVILTPYFRMAC